MKDSSPVPLPASYSSVRRSLFHTPQPFVFINLSLCPSTSSSARARWPFDRLDSRRAQLIELLKSEDKNVVSIACYDLGEFVRFYPSGKTIVKHLG